MDRVTTLKRQELLRELQSYKKYNNKTQKEISEKLGGIDNLRKELRLLEHKLIKVKSIDAKKESYFEKLPLELITHITEQHDVKNARLINKQTLKANQIKFCNEIKITQQDINHYIEHAQHRFAIKVPMKASIFTQHGRLLFLMYHMKNVDVMPGMMNPMEEALKNRTDKELDLYSYYFIYKSKGCDEIIKHYARNKVINMLKENKFKNLKRYVYLVTNAVVMGLVKKPESMKNHDENINENLYATILAFLQQLD